MQVGVFAKTFSGRDPNQVLAACKAAGFSAAQYNMACSGLKSLPGSVSDEIACAVATASADNGVQIAAVSATYNMTDPDLERRQTGRLGFKAIAQNAAQMGTNLLTVCSGSRDPEDQWRHHPANKNPESWIDMCSEFEIIFEIAEKHDLLIGVEPEHANIVSSSQAARRLLDEFPGSPIRIVLDPANILEDVPQDSQRKTIDEAIDLLGPKIALAHAKDRMADGTVAPAGKGMVDWKYFLNGLAKIGFEGPLIAHGISASEAPKVANFLTQQIEQL